MLIATSEIIWKQTPSRTHETRWLADYVAIEICLYVTGPETQLTANSDPSQISVFSESVDRSLAHIEPDGQITRAQHRFASIVLDGFHGEWLFSFS